jgi:hypothetical protein
MKRQQRNIGDVVKIDLGDGFHSYARVLQDASFAVYDCRTQDDLPMVQILFNPILFWVAVMDSAVKKGRWTIVGSAPLEPSLVVPPPKFIQDPMDKEKFSIYEHGQIRPAKKEECIGLERASVWDPEHVEDRIRDHYAGKVNKWVESEKIKS